MWISLLFSVYRIAMLALACSTVITQPPRYPWQSELDTVVIDADFEPTEIRSSDGMTIANCTRKQAEDLISTVAQAQVVLDVVLQARHHEGFTPMSLSELLDIEHRYFGNVSESLCHYMTEILEVVRDNWNQTQYICEDVCITAIENAAAYVYHNRPRVIHVCESFHLHRSAQLCSAQGNGAKYATYGARTILHEKLHLVHHGVFEALSPKYMRPIADYAYHAPACQQLVHDTPELTFLNADSWANYMMEVYLGMKVGMPLRQRHLQKVIGTPVAGMEVFGGLPAWQRLLHLIDFRDWIASYQRTRNSRTFKNWKSGTEEARNEH